MKKKLCSKFIKVEYTQIKAEQEEVDKRLSRAFDLLFAEVVKIRGIPNNLKTNITKL